MLARKLRPMGFDALVGQEHVVRALRHALDEGRLHHAYLFTGTRGVGKTTIARIVAKSLNCEQGVSATPCEQCSICNEIRENRFVDLIEVDAASRTGVDDTRELLENAQYLPTRGRYKVYLIDEVHMLSTASFNALLKTLEEPPEHVKFLLATTDPKKVPVTVLSRCLQFQLKNLSRDAISDYLAKVLSEEGVEFDAGALEVVARSAAGSMRDALSLTDQAIAYGQGALRGADVTDMLGVVGRDEVGALLGALFAGDAPSLMELAAALAERNADFADVLKGMVEAFHAMAVQQALGEQGDNPGFSAEELHLYYQIGLVGQRDLHNAPEARSGFEMTVLRMLAFAPERNSQVPPRSLPGGQNGDPEAAADPQTPQQAADPQTPQEAADPQTSQEAVVAAEAPDDHWFDLVDRLQISGVARMVAEHSVLQTLALPQIELLLDEGHDALLNDAQVQTLSRALEAVLGEPVKLQLNIGPLPWESPAQRRERLSQERQAEAERAIEQDEKVHKIIDEFDGRVEQVRPL